LIGRTKLENLAGIGTGVHSEERSLKMAVLRSTVHLLLLAASTHAFQAAFSPLRLSLTGSVQLAAIVSRRGAVLPQRLSVRGRGRVAAPAPYMSGKRAGGTPSMPDSVNPVTLELQNAVRLNDLLMIQDMVQAGMLTPDLALCKVRPPEPGQASARAPRLPPARVPNAHGVRCA
jgi:hypothetical protein